MVYFSGTEDDGQTYFYGHGLAFGEEWLRVRVGPSTKLAKDSGYSRSVKGIKSLMLVITRHQ